jgi:hypothetical protein
MKTLIALLALLTITGQTLQLFPDMTAEGLDGKKVNIPSSTKGKYTLIGIAWSKKAQTSLQTWYQPAYWKFIYKPEKNSVLAEEPYDINLYMIVAFTGSNQSLYGEGVKEIKSKTDAIYQPYVLTWKGDFKPIQQQLKLDKPDEPWFFLLDEQGNIVWQDYGAYSEAKMEMIESFLEEE